MFLGVTVLQGARLGRFAPAFLALALALTTYGPGSPASASASLPLGFSDELVASIGAPTAIAFTPDGRMLVASKSGALRVVKNGAVLGTPAIDLTSKICSNSERGLLGVAVDPAFASNHFVYLYYTFKKFTGCPLEQDTAPVNRVSRFILPDSNVVSPSSELVVIDNMLSYGGYHNAGDLRFGKDNHLYVSVGDGGCDYAGTHGCARNNNAARDTNVLLGKILRVNRDGTIPADNPFTTQVSARCGITGSTAPGTWCKEIYALGLRNPFRFAMDPNASTTRFYVNDVGQNIWEEIDFGQAGADYGWNVREGHCATGSTVNCGPPPAGMTNPIFDYEHSTGCGSITGGAFVPANSGWPDAYTGKYLFADYVCGKIFVLDPDGSGFTMTPFATGLGNSTAVHMEFGPPAPKRALYYATFANGGEIRRITFSSAPVAELVATPTSGIAPLTVTFDGSESADPEGEPLTYLWNFGDGTSDSTTTAIVSHVYGTDGTFTGSLTVRDAEGIESDPDLVTIMVGNTPPAPVISSPAEGETFAVGQTITLVGSATDAQDGTIPDALLSWTVQRFHVNHTHPYVGPVSGNNITFSAPAPEDPFAATNSYLIVSLSATDSNGVSTTVTRTIQPRKVLLTFRTNPTGLDVKVNAITRKAPTVVTSWEGWVINVQAPSPQGKYVFVSWSDGGTKTHTITTPAAPTTYTARYVKVAAG